jgi:type I restriction enzyme M protein
MAKRSTRTTKTSGGRANLGFEAQLWKAADALRSNMDAAEYKHVVLGLIFLKYISDAFEEQRAKIEGEREQGADPEDPDEYRRFNIFWVPPEARWDYLHHPSYPLIPRDKLIACLLINTAGHSR